MMHAHGVLVAAACLSSYSLVMAASLPTDFFLDVDGVSIAPGVNHICVLEAQPGIDIGGRPTCWGAKDHDKCNAPKDETFVQIVSGMYYSCGVTLEQSVMCWGRLPDVPISGLYSQITGGKHYACGVMTDGRLNCWGLINAGVKREIPTEVYMEAHNIERFVQVSCEDNHCCALDDKGHAHCWGEEQVWGAMVTPREGIVSVEQEAVPGSDETMEAADFYGFSDEEDLQRSNNDALENIAFKQISAGYQFNCGIRYDNGDLVCWGHVDKLLYGSSSGGHLTMEGPFKQVSAGVLGACALYEDGAKPALCMGAAKSTMSGRYSVEYDQIAVSSTMICGINIDNSQLECGGMNSNMRAATPHGLEIA